MFAFMQRALACALFVVAAASVARAQAAPTPSPEPSEIGHVTTTDRQDEPVTKTSRPTFIVDRRSIEATGSRTIAEALRTVPGVSLFSYGAYGAQTNYGLLGGNSSQTLVLVNGFPVAAGTSGTIDLGSYSTSGVDRIEVVEGGGSTLYGSSAVGGVINIITGHAPDGPYAELSDGTLADRDARAAYASHGASISYERHLATNVYDYPAMNGYPAGTRTNAGAQSTAVRADFRSTGSSKYVVDASFGDQAVGIGVPGSLAFPSTDARQATAQMDGHAGLTRNGERSSLSLTFSGSHQALLYNDPAFGGESDTYDSRVQGSLRWVTGGDRSSLVSGIDLSRESAALYFGASSTPPDASAALSQSAIYSQYRGALGDTITYTAGLRGEHDSPQGSVLDPSLGVQVRAGTYRFGANYADSFRVPTIDDLYYPGFSNPLLQPERSHNVDFSVATGRYSLTWFQRQATNLIALDSNFVPQNAALASIAGLVFSARTPPVHGVVATAGITNLYRALNLSPGAPASRLSFEPTFTGTVGLELPFGPGVTTSVGINARIVGPYNSSGTPDGGETTADMWIRQRLGPIGVASVRLRNIGNERYAPIVGYPAPGRTIEFELSTR